MLDFIFLTGTSGIGKTALAQRLFRHYRSTYIEQNMVPEFISQTGGEAVTGLLEEETCWENTRAMALTFHRLGYRNILVTDLDDLRTADLPLAFRGYRFVTLRMICRDPDQLHRQMHGRQGGLVDDELQRKCSEKTQKRPLLVNEAWLDVTGLGEEAVLRAAVAILDRAEPLTEYEYTKPPRELFYSWVPANGLR